MIELTPDLIQQFLNITGQELTGDWVLIGGTVLSAVGHSHRATMDIDFVGTSSTENAQQLAVVKIAVQMGLPVETINMTGAYFLHTIDDFVKHLVVFRKTKNCTLFVPNLYLYLRLKMSRLSETDVTDCLDYIDYCSQHKEEYVPSIELVLKFISSKRAEASASPKAIAIQQILNKAQNVFK